MGGGNEISYLGSGVLALRGRLNPEPDGVQRRQEHERENRPREGSADQGVRQRSPEEIDAKGGVMETMAAGREVRSNLELRGKVLADPLGLIPICVPCLCK